MATDVTVTVSGRTSAGAAGDFVALYPKSKTDAWADTYPYTAKMYSYPLPTSSPSASVTITVNESTSWLGAVLLASGSYTLLAAPVSLSVCSEIDPWMTFRIEVAALTLVDHTRARTHSPTHTHSSIS